jgi:hypothetical protein
MNAKTTQPAGAQTIEVLTNPAALAVASPDELAAAIDRRNALMDKIRDAALKSTWSEQWCDMDGKPWPTAAAAETVARRCAVRVHSTSYKREDRVDDEGSFYFYVYTGTVELPGGLDSTEVPGTCSSRDQFLGTTAAGGRDLSDINEDDVMKAAYSNMIVNGVMRLLGLRGMTWERLKDFGLDPEKAAKIEHKKGARGGSSKMPHAERELPFGRSKGKKLTEAEEADLQWILARFKESAEDPDKAKYRDDNLAWVKAISEEFARRANAKAGVTPSNGHNQAPSIWERILALPEAKGVPEAELKPIIKSATSKPNAGALEEADIAKVQAALKQRKTRHPEDSINFD